MGRYVVIEIRAGVDASVVMRTGGAVMMVCDRK